MKFKVTKIILIISMQLSWMFQFNLCIHKIVDSLSLLTYEAFSSRDSCWDEITSPRLCIILDGILVLGEIQDNDRSYHRVEPLVAACLMKTSLSINLLHWPLPGDEQMHPC